MSAPDSEALLAARLSRAASKRRKRILKLVVKRDGPHCFWCGGPTLMAPRHLLRTASRPGKRDGELRKMVRTLDHIVPGGPDTVENGLCSCYGCNHRRGNMDASVFMFSLIRKAPLECRGFPVVSRSAGAPPMPINSLAVAKSSAESTGGSQTWF